MAKKTLRSADADETMDRAAEEVSTSDTSGPETDTPKKPRAPRRRKPAAVPDADASTPDGETPDAAPKRASRRRTAAPDAETPDEAPKRRTSRKKDAAPPTDAAAPEAAPTPRRRRTVDEVPVASSDNLPAEGADDRSESKREAPAEEAPRRRRTRQIDLTTDRSHSDRPRSDQDDRVQESRDTRQPDTRNQENLAQDSRSQNDRDDDGGRRKRKRNRNKNKSRDGQNQGGGTSQSQGGGNSQSQGSASPQSQGGGQNSGGGHPGEPFEGMLELIGDKKFGFIREFSTSLVKGDNDPFMPPPLIQKYNLRDGVRLKGLIKPGRKGAWQVSDVTEVMGGEPEAWTDVPDFDDGMVIYPEEKLQFVTGPQDVSMRVVDLVAPMGKGQRALIVAPPRAGKTILLKQIAEGAAQNHPEVALVALLIDERPEEVTDFRRNTAATVFSSSNDFGEDNHVRVATLAFEYARRLVEQGKDVLVLLDSLTRLGRMFNLFGGNSGRTMSGGLDARALLMPRKIFGSARNIENGGSLTIIATALIETNSRMDEVIFEEFKGTGNSEIVLDRELSEKRIYPAINIRKSGTRNEERLVPDELVRQRHMLLRALNSRHPVEAMQALAKQIQLSPTNVHLLNELVPETAY